MVGMAESLRHLELPTLQPPGGDGGALAFGDWLAVVTPIMLDVSGSAQQWWVDVVKTAEDTYLTWLHAAPLARLRLRPEELNNPQFARVEKRGVSMLLAAIPDSLRRDLISTRTLSTTSILYKLFITYQPGGSAERGFLLKQLTETKPGSAISEIVGSIKLWRRWVSRAEELNITLPDGMVLSSVLMRYAESLGRLGGQQVAYRVATVRQELGVDLRPTLTSIKEMAEYIQAEAEELSLALPPGKVHAVATPSPTPVVKALQVEQNDSLKAPPGLGTSAEKRVSVTPSKPCRFWGTDGGCRKGDSCGFIHDWTGIAKTGRCFLCSATGHTRRDCPVRSREQDAEKTKKVAKVRSGLDGKGDAAGAATTSSVPNISPAAENASNSVDESASVHGNVSTSNVMNTAPADGQSGEADRLLQEATNLLKSLRSMRALQLNSMKPGGQDADVPVALLDGGATHALRQMRDDEKKNASPVKVELACGTTVLYTHPSTKALLSTDPVEPLVPLRGLIDAGFNIKWNADGCRIHHPVLGRLDCWLRNGCPVMRKDAALKLLDYLDEPVPRTLLVNDEDWWRSRFPDTPDRVLRFMQRVEDWGEAGQ